MLKTELGCLVVTAHNWVIKKSFPHSGVNVLMLKYAYKNI